MDARRPERVPREPERAYIALCAWLAQTDRPRSMPRMVAAGICSNTNGRRWRVRYSWDARAAAWDAASAGVPPPRREPTPEEVSAYAAEDPITRGRRMAQGWVTECLEAIHDVVVDTEQKPHLRLSAACELLEVAGLAKVSRPKVDPVDQLKKARSFSRKLASSLTPDEALRMLEAREARKASDGSE